MSNSLVVWGAGGHGKVVLDLARCAGRFERILFVDDDTTKAGVPFCNCTVVSPNGNLPGLARYEFVVAVGDNRQRVDCFRRAQAAGLSATKLIHPRAVVASSASVGPGTVIMAGAIVNAAAVIGKNCIINTAAVVEHDCRIGDHVHISPRVVIGGRVHVEAFAHIGIGAIVLSGATVGEEATVGAGAVVLKKAPAHCTVVGVPAKAITYM
jgi:sugar O-acyltransferase (sialic acid O-acetyltransferase NeuD family)